MYFDTFGSQIPLSAYGLIMNLRGFIDSVVDSFQWTYLFFPAFLVTTMLLCSSKRNESLSPLTRRAYLLVATLTPLIVASTFNIQEPFRQRYQRLRYTHSENMSIAVLYSPFTNLASQFRDFNRLKLNDKERRSINMLIQQNKKCVQNRSGGRRYMSLIIILLESFESFVIDLTINGQPIAPNISRMTHEDGALYVANVMPMVGTARSMDAQLLVNCGLIPPSNEAFCFTYPGNQYPSIAKIMADKRSTNIRCCMTTDLSSTYNQSAIARAFGYNKLKTRSDYQTYPPDAIHVDDSVFFAQSTHMLADSIWPIGVSAVIQMVSYSCHTPFQLPGGATRLDFAGIHPIMAKYLNVIHFSDAAVGRFVEYLKRRTDYESMLVVITGDHNAFSFARRAKYGSGKFGSDKSVTPLIILNSPVSGKIEHIVMQSAIFPTLLELLDLTDSDWPGIGQSVFNADTTIYEARYISDLIMRYDYLGRR